MSLEKRINAFVQLGLFLKQFNEGDKDDSLSVINNKFYDDFIELILRQKAYNGWFTKKECTEFITRNRAVFITRKP